ncbi:MAG: TetR/AcrR family transcriptional regulator [Candidatus Aminicenantaceae bacterium]
MEKRNLKLERELHRREDNKIFILKAAERVIAQKGYSTATMDDIAEEAQFSKATLYRYFKSKGELFIEIIVNSLEELNQKLRETKKKRGSSEKRLEEVAHLVLRHFEEKENIARIFFMDKFLMEKLQIFATEQETMTSELEKLYIKKIKDKHKEMLNGICEILNSGVESGEFRKLDAKDTAMVLESMLYGFYYGRYWGDRKYSLEKGETLIQRHFFHGIKKEEKE